MLLRMQSSRVYITVTTKPQEHLAKLQASCFSVANHLGGFLQKKNLIAAPFRNHCRNNKEHQNLKIHYRTSNCQATLLSVAPRPTQQIYSDFKRKRSFSQQVGFQNCNYAMYIYICISDHTRIFSHVTTNHEMRERLMSCIGPKWNRQLLLIFNLFTEKTSYKKTTI